MERVCMLVTDGAPSMTGKVNGLAARWSAVAQQMMSLHCIVHQMVLCAKLRSELKMTMDSVMATINFICSTSSLQHLLFCKLLPDMSAEHRNLLLHNDVRWLSKGKALEHFCDLNEESTTFLCSIKLKKTETHLNHILDNNFMSDVCFLSDIFKHLNELNVWRQGRDKTVIDPLEQMRHIPSQTGAFRDWLDHRQKAAFPNAPQTHLIPGTDRGCDNRFHCEVETELCQSIGRTWSSHRGEALSETRPLLLQKGTCPPEQREWSHPSTRVNSYSKIALIFLFRFC